MDQGNPDLRHHSLFACSEKTFDLQILLDPLKKEFDLPALFIDSGNARCRKFEVICNEVVIFIIFFIIEFNKTQFSGIFSAGQIPCKTDNIITNYPEFFIPFPMLSEELDLSI